MASDRGRAVRRSSCVLDAAEIAPTVTWGINPGQSVGVDGRLPKPARRAAARTARRSRKRSSSWAVRPGSRSPARGSTSRSSARARTAGCRTCAKPRESSRGHHVAPHVRALVVPGSQAVRAAAEREGLDEVFRAAGFDWRGAGCSMCLAMNPDRLEGREVCASSSNRNFKGRQGSPTGRTLLMSPAMVAAAAMAGEVVDVRALGGGAVSASRDHAASTGPAIVAAAATTSTPTASCPRGSSRPITFEGLEAHVFEDDRREAAGRGRDASVRRPARRRRARPARRRAISAAARRASTRRRRIARWGIRAVVGESFAEIFFGNSLMIGLPCVTASPRRPRRAACGGRRRRPPRFSRGSRRATRDGRIDVGAASLPDAARARAAVRRLGRDGAAAGRLRRGRARRGDCRTLPDSGH